MTLKIACIITAGDGTKRPVCSKEYAETLEEQLGPQFSNAACTVFNSSILALECSAFMYFDMIIIEKDMDDLDGLEFLATLTAVNSPTPVVVLVDTKDDQSDQYYIDRGFSAVLKDPFSAHMLCQMIRTVIFDTPPPVPISGSASDSITLISNTNPVTVALPQSNAAQTLLHNSNSLRQLPPTTVATANYSAPIAPVDANVTNAKTVVGLPQSDATRTLFQDSLNCLQQLQQTHVDSALCAVKLEHVDDSHNIKQFYADCNSSSHNNSVQQLIAQAVENQSTPTSHSSTTAKSTPSPFVPVVMGSPNRSQLPCAHAHSISHPNSTYNHPLTSFSITSTKNESNPMQSMDPVVSEQMDKTLLSVVQSHDIDLNDSIISDNGSGGEYKYNMNNTPITAFLESHSTIFDMHGNEIGHRDRGTSSTCTIPVSSITNTPNDFYNIIDK